MGAAGAALALAAALVASPCALAEEATQPPQWLQHTWRWGYHDIGPQWFVDTGADSATVVASSMKQAGAEGLVVRIQDPSGPSWRTKYGGRPAFMKDRDLVAELGAACRERGLRFIGYIWALYDEPAWQQHEDWRILNSGGNPVGQFVCCNSPYRDLVRDRLVELARDYPNLHGVFFDMFHWHRVGCYCRYCREGFKALTGQDPPAKEDFDDPLWRRWQEFQHRSIERALADWRAAVRQVRPDFVILANTWNGWIFHNAGMGGSSVRVADSLDGTLEEEGWYWGAGEESFFGFPQRWPFMNLYLRSMGDNAAGPGRCVAHMWEAGNVPPALNGPLPTMEVVARVADMISFGVHPWPYFRRGPEGMKRVFDFVKAREPWLNDAHLVPWCGLVVSENTQFWYGRNEPMTRYVQGIHGVLRALWEQHLPVEILTDEDLERRELGAYRVILLGNTACLSDRVAQRVRDYVRAGGGLVATFEASLYDEGGRKRADFALGDLLGAKFVSGAREPSFLGATANQSVLSPYAVQLLQANVNDITGKPQGGMPFPAGTLIVQAAEGAQTALTLWCADEKGTAVAPPGLVAQSFGQGKVVYIPADLGKSAFFCNFEYVDRVLSDALRWAAAEPPAVEVAAPRTVISVPQQQGSRLLVHLLNDYCSFGRSSVVKGQSIALRHEVLPARDLGVTFRDARWRRFTLEPGGIRLTPRKVPTGTTVMVPAIEWHGIVVAEP